MRPLLAFCVAFAIGFVGAALITEWLSEQLLTAYDPELDAETRASLTSADAIVAGLGCGVLVGAFAGMVAEQRLRRTAIR